MGKMFLVECWQRVSYLVLADSPARASKNVKDGKARVGVVGEGEVNDAGIVVKEPTLEQISGAKAVHQGVMAG